LYTILEYCSKGEFFGYLQNAAFELEVARHYFKQLMEGCYVHCLHCFALLHWSHHVLCYGMIWYRPTMIGVYFLHSKNVCHRDLSLENLLMDDKQVLKICDFGVAIESPKDTLLPNKDPNRRPGKYRYMAPEVYHHSPIA
jgi:serine/threonine protein kinase